MWLGVIAFLAAVYFILLGTQTQSGRILRILHVVTAVIMGTAAFSYLMMASGAVLLKGGRIFYYLRYI